MILFREEILFAEITLVLLDLQMNSFAMINQGGIGLKSRPAFRTKKAFDIFMHRYFVNT